ncbi:hypothetical protein Tco_1211483 [Tanacetum coccineum]
MPTCSTLNHHKIVREEAIILKKDFKQKEDKFLEEFLDIKRLKEKVEDRLYKQDQSVQTVHMICKPKSFNDEKNKVMSNHARLVVHDSEDTRDMAEITRKRMMEKMKSPLCVENKIRIAPQITSERRASLQPLLHQESTLEQIFWLFKTYDGESLKAQELCEKVHQDGNNHVGAIMGYGDYMIGDSVVFRAYYVEGLGHNLFSVGQFCDSDLEVAFRKHSCFVRNMEEGT